MSLQSEWRCPTSPLSAGNGLILATGPSEVAFTLQQLQAQWGTTHMRIFVAVLLALLAALHAGTLYVKRLEKVPLQLLFDSSLSFGCSRPSVVWQQWQQQQQLQQQQLRIWQRVQMFVAMHAIWQNSQAELLLALCKDIMHDVMCLRRSACHL